MGTDEVSSSVGESWSDLIPTLTKTLRFKSLANPEDIYQHAISCGPLNQTRLSQVIGTLRRFLAEYPAISLISVPDSFLYLNAHTPHFKKFLVANRERINLVSQHWEAFYGQAVFAGSRRSNPS